MKFLKSILSKTSFVLLVTVLSSVGVKAMGTLEPQGEAGDDTHKSLKDLLNKLNDYTYTPGATSSPFATPGMVTATFPTLTEIYDLLESEDADLIPTNLAQGVTIFGVDGTLVAAASPRLQWSADSVNANFGDAGAYCDDLDEASETDWRLPTVLELYEGYFDESLPNYNSQPYWAEHPISSGGSSFLVSPNGDDISIVGDSGDQDFVCVRTI